MEKLRLKLDDLQVDSFQITPAAKAKGTVLGEQCTCHTCPGCPTCAGYGTCDASCNGTCDASCNGTCLVSCNGTCDASCYDSCDVCPPTWYASCNPSYVDRPCEAC
jgi:hypothetical protein